MWAALALTVAFGAFGALLTVLQARQASRIITLAFLQGVGLSGVIPLAWTLLGFILLRALCVGGAEISAPKMAARIKSHLREVVYAHLQRLGPAYTQSERTGELTVALKEGVEALEGFYSQYLPQLGLAALIPLAILFTVFPLDLLSGLVMLVTAPLIPFFMVLIGNLAEGLTHKQWALLGKLSAHYLDTLQGLETLKQLGRSRDQAASLARMGEQYREATLQVLRVTFLSALVLELIATLSTAILAVEIGLRLLHGGIAFEQALLILILAPEFYLPLRALGQKFHAGAAGISAARRVFAILDQPAPATLREPAHVSLPPSNWPITFHGVSYSYPGNQLAALDHISLTLRAGQNIALIGPSGAGKTTLSYLLLRFIQPTSGWISAAGVPLDELPIEAWRERIAWVPQRPHLFHESIAANLRIARADAALDDLRTAARTAHLDEWIRSLPAAYETVIGEDGARLSSGQAQRLALARAFLKDAPFLILDEPTANLDPELEASLEADTRALAAGRTVLTIAHRLSTVSRADQVLVLEGGRIVESGSPSNLLSQAGLYCRMVGAFTSEGGLP
ncbi:MAG TPA: thiol reductant ABC exporter subunit CydD [Anaerolineaceae bacterium]|nr:thiol reductant ABC exporter subunit CydD [Anaerolineaceae bacterium]